MKRSRIQHGALLLRYLEPQRRQVMVLAALLLGTIGLELVNPLLLRSFIDAARAGASVHTLTITALMFLVVALVTQVMTVAEAYVAGNVGWTATNRLRADLALHCLRLDPAFHSAHTP